MISFRYAIVYASSVAFVRRVDHSSFILSCNLIGQRENKSRYVTEIVLPLGYADVIFRRRESRQPEIRLRSQATKLQETNSNVGARSICLVLHATPFGVESRVTSYSSCITHSQS